MTESLNSNNDASWVVQVPYINTKIFVSSLPYNIAVIHFVFLYALITPYITAFISLNQVSISSVRNKKIQVFYVSFL